MQVEDRVVVPGSVECRAGTQVAHKGGPVGEVSLKLTIESYTLDDPKVLKITKDVAILRYKCDLKGSFDGKTFKPVYATEVWVNRGGKWQIVSYSETPVS
jgi:hypothetical protein